MSNQIFEAPEHGFGATLSPFLAIHALNHSQIRGKNHVMLKIILSLNLLVSFGSAVAAVIAVLNPAVLSGSHDAGSSERFYVRMYAVRSIPFGLATGFLPFWIRGPGMAWILFVAAAIQVSDVVIGLGKRERGMVKGAAAAGLVHILCGFAINSLRVAEEAN